MPTNRNPDKSGRRVDPSSGLTNTGGVSMLRTLPLADTAVALPQVTEDFLADLRIAGRSPRTIEDHAVQLRYLGAWCDARGLHWQAVRHKQLKALIRTRAHLGHSSRTHLICTLRV